MSIARVKTSKFAARKGKSIKCQKCGRAIEKGEVYRWWFVGFRSRYKHVRCMACPAPRSSELESSQKSEAYAAVETAQDALDALTEPGEASDLDSIVSDAAEGVREVASNYRSADEAFGGGGSTVSGELADELESAADELESFSADDFDDSDPHWCDEHDGEGVEADAAREEQCDECDRIQAEQRQAWWDEQVDAAREALDGVSF